MFAYVCVIILVYSGEISVNHEYEGDWSEKTRLTTCDAHAKRAVTNSEAPQEVEDKKEIIFTYDVEFVVSSHISSSQVNNFSVNVLACHSNDILLYLPDLPPCRRVM